MTFKRIGAVVALAVLGLGACQSIPKEQSLVEYCGDVKHANKDVCKVNIEIDGQKRALADTNVSVREARAIAEEARSSAATAQKAADDKKMYCETRTLQRTDIGSCSAGYTLVSCTQSRYTYRAGGPSIMRSIDDSQCRFHDKVLEIKVRCCTAAGAAPPIEADALSPAAPSTPAQSS